MYMYTTSISQQRNTTNSKPSVYAHRNTSNDLIPCMESLKRAPLKGTVHFEVFHNFVKKKREKRKLGR